jgi:hypothetical protein
MALPTLYITAKDVRNGVYIGEDVTKFKGIIDPNLSIVKLYEGNIDIAPNLGTVTFPDGIRVQGSIIAHEKSGIASSRSIVTKKYVESDLGIKAKSIIVDGWIKVGGDIESSNGIQAGGDIEVGGRIRSCDYVISAKGIIAGKDIDVGGYDVGKNNNSAYIQAVNNVEAGGNIFASSNIEAGGDMKAGGNINAGFNIIVAGGDISAGKNIEADHNLYVGKSVKAGHNIKVNYQIRAGEDIVAGDSIRAGQEVKAGGDIEAGGDIKTRHYIEAGGDIIAEFGIETDCGVMAGGDIKSCAGIKVSFNIIGKTISAKFLILDEFVYRDGVTKKGHIKGTVLSGDVFYLERIAGQPKVVAKMRTSMAP